MFWNFFKSAEIAFDDVPTAKFQEMAEMITETRKHALVADHFQNLVVAADAGPQPHLAKQQEQVLLDALTTSGNPVKTAYDQAARFARLGFQPIRRSITLLKEMFLDTYRQTQRHTLYQKPNEPNGVITRQSAIDEYFENRIVHPSRTLDEKVKGFFSNHPSLMTDWCQNDSAEEDDEV